MPDHWSQEDFRMGACCPVTGIELREVISTFPSNHPLAGEPRKVGAALPHTRVVVLLMTDGSTMSLSVHQSCVGEIPILLPQIWRKLKTSTRRIRKAHRSLRQKPFSPAQNAIADLENCRMNDNLPLGVLCVLPWSKSDG